MRYKCLRIQDLQIALEALKILYLEFIVVESPLISGCTWTGRLFPSFCFNACRLESSSKSSHPHRTLCELNSTYLLYHLLFLKVKLRFINVLSQVVF